MDGKILIKYEIWFLFILIISISVSPVRAEPVNPNLNYYNGNPFEIEEYNVTEIVKNALQMGYVIRNTTFPGGCRNPLPEGGCKGRDIILERHEYINTDNEFSFLNSPKKLYINYPNQFAQIKVSTDNIEFGYAGRVGFHSDDPQMTTEQASEIIVNELKALGILDQDANITIQFESYVPPILFSNGSGQQFTTTLLIIVLAVIIVIVLIVRGKLK